jgi:hypothetical protein
MTFPVLRVAFRSLHTAPPRMGVFRIALLCVGCLIAVQAAWAQTSPSGGAPSPLRGLGLTTVQWGEAQNAGTVFFGFDPLPRGQLALVVGQTYDRERNKRDYDVGVKLLDGANLVRGTLYGANPRGSRSGVSAGLDWDVGVARLGSGRLAVLGDIGTVAANRQNLDFGLGAKLTAAEWHNLFLLVSRRNSIHQKDLRFGYLYLDPRRLAAVVLDRAWNGKLILRGFWGGPQNRLQIYYDRNDRTLFSAGILSFGNEPLPNYAIRGFLATQLILTRRSVLDADYIKFLQSPYFLRPRGRVSDILRITLLQDLRSDTLRSGLIYNALFLRVRGGNGVVLTQNYDRVRGRNLLGGGVGYRFSHFTPVLRYQGGDGRLVTFDLNFSY